MKNSEIKITYEGIDYQISYKMRSNSGKWLVLMHGLQSNSEIFEPFFSAEVLKSFSLLAPDFIGFGDSSKPKNFTYDLEDKSNILALFLKELKITNFSLIGHSLGGMIATLALEKMPSQISSVISLEGNLTQEDCGESAESSNVTFDWFKKNYPKKLEEIRDDNQLTGPMRYHWLQTTPDYSFYLTSKSIVHWSSTGRLFDIFQESLAKKLLIVGGDSKFHSRPRGSALKISTIAKAGHFMLIEKPAEVLQAILKFL